MQVDNGTDYWIFRNGTVYIGRDDLKTVNENVFKITDPSQYILNGDNGNLTKAASDAILQQARVKQQQNKTRSL